MTSFKQIQANRCNASKSTGPATEEGKLRSRCNAVRHGLAAETVIGAFEDAQDYKAFEAAIIFDYDASSAVERELVLRLASLLWRLRRATSMETGLFEIHADNPSKLEEAHRLSADSRVFGYAPFESAPIAEQRAKHSGSDGVVGNAAVELARCFLTLPNSMMDRLNRYETALWRQVGQTLFALDALERRKPQERIHRRLPAGDPQKQPIHRDGER